MERNFAGVSGAGIFGSHFRERLVGEGPHVIHVDNFHTGRRADVPSLMASGRFDLIEHDIAEPFGHTLPFHALTSEICGDPDVHPHVEGEGPMGPFGVCR